MDLGRAEGARDTRRERDGREAGERRSDHGKVRREGEGEDTGGHNRGSESGSGSGGGIKPGDFEWGEILGEGSYSRVRKAVRRSSGDVFAIKVVEKADQDEVNRRGGKLESIRQCW